MKTYELTYAVYMGEQSASCPGRFIPSERGIYLLDRRLQRPQNRFGRFGKDYFLLMPGIKPRPSSCLASNLDALPTELSQADVAYRAVWPLMQFQTLILRSSKHRYRMILSVLDPRKCEYLKDYSLDFEHAYMTTYLAS